MDAQDANEMLYTLPSEDMLDTLTVASVTFCIEVGARISWFKSLGIWVVSELQLPQL